MRNSSKRVFSDLSLMAADKFIEKCRLLKGSHFTRNRKMPLRNLLLSVMFRKGRTLYMELRSFKKLFKMNTQISKPGYLKQRMKLNPEALKMLAKHHAEQFYKDSTAVKTYKSHLILAIDGTSLNVPLTEENLATYGNTAKHGGRPRPQIGLSCLFDVLNRTFIDMSTASCKFNERTEAVVHVDNTIEVTGNKERIYVFDRGYPSGEFFLDLMERNVNFLVRLGSASFRREQKGMNADDCMVNIIFDKTRVGASKKAESANRLAAAGGVTLRFVHLKLDNGDDEYLATNISGELFDTKEICSLYRLRWGIETVFDDLKNKLQIENFTGEKPVIMEQDIYATFYLSNIINDIMQDIAAELSSEDMQKRKHEMQLNRNIAIGIIKEDLILVILEKRLRKRKSMMESIVQEIESNILPVRPDRNFVRPVGKLASKYSNVRKRSF